MSPEDISSQVRRILEQGKVQAQQAEEALEQAVPDYGEDAEYDDGYGEDQNEDDEEDEDEDDDDFIFGDEDEDEEVAGVDPEDDDQKEYMVTFVRTGEYFVDARGSAEAVVKAQAELANDYGEEATQFTIAKVEEV